MNLSTFCLPDALGRYITPYIEEQDFIRQFYELLRNHPEESYCRELPHAHLTGSAWIINRQADQVLLMHHRKLGKWLQPGGHADGDRDLRQVARKEAGEETGVENLMMVKEGIIFDLDIHKIPARKQDPAHFHFDVRFAFTADHTVPLRQNSESMALAWVALEEVGEKCDHNRSIMRMVEKTFAMKQPHNT